MCACPHSRDHENTELAELAHHLEHGKQRSKVKEVGQAEQVSYLLWRTGWGQMPVVLKQSQPCTKNVAGYTLCPAPQVELNMQIQNTYEHQDWDIFFGFGFEDFFFLRESGSKIMNGLKRKNHIPFANL